MFVAKGAVETLREKRKEQFYDTYIAAMLEEAGRLRITPEEIREMIERGVKMSGIEIRDVTKSFGRMNALEHVSVTFEPDKIYGLLGRNGAGKSTLLNIITNRVLPHRWHGDDGRGVHARAGRPARQGVPHE